MSKNKLKNLWSSGKSSVNGWLSIPSAFGAEVMASQGYDSLTIDIQHGVIDYAEAVRMLQSLAAYPITPLVRVSWLDPGLIMKVLDSGACGVICPMINTKEQAKKFVEFCRYPPLGGRSFGPTRVLYSYGENYYNEANEEIICLAMIETAEAMKNLDEIVSTPGLDGVYIGPSDLSLGIGNGKFAPGFDRKEPEMVEAIKSILKSAKRSQIIAGLHCGSPEYAAKAIKWGFDMTTISSDAKLMSTAARASVNKLKELVFNNYEEKSSNNSDDTGY
jgi:4-hydroxy-2-oxoheptanedioate aldolase